MSENIEKEPYYRWATLDKLSIASCVPGQYGFSYRCLLQMERLSVSGPRDFNSLLRLAICSEVLGRRRQFYRTSKRIKEVYPQDYQRVLNYLASHRRRGRAEGCPVLKRLDGLMKKGIPEQYCEDDIKNRTVEFTTVKRLRQDSLTRHHSFGG